MDRQNKLEMYNKKKQYAQFIKMAHQPNVDDKKKEELQDRINSLKHPVKQAVKVPPGTIVKVVKRPTSVNTHLMQNQSAGSAQITSSPNNPDFQQFGVLNDQNGGGIVSSSHNSTQSTSLLTRRNDRSAVPSLQT